MPSRRKRTESKKELVSSDDPDFDPPSTVEDGSQAEEVSPLSRSDSSEKGSPQLPPSSLSVASDPDSSAGAALDPDGDDSEEGEPPLSPKIM